MRPCNLNCTPPRSTLHAFLHILHHVMSGCMLMCPLHTVAQEAIAGGLRHGGSRADLQRGASLLAPAADGEHGAGTAGDAAWGQDAAGGHGGAGTPGWREGRRRGRR
jgi:hypothetical protein